MPRLSTIPLPGGFTQGFTEGSNAVGGLLNSLLNRAATRERMQNAYAQTMMAQQFLPHKIANLEANTADLNLKNNPQAFIERAKQLVSTLPADQQKDALYSILTGKSPGGTADAIANKINQTEQINQSKQDIKDASAIKSSALKLAGYWQDIQTMKKLLKENPNLTGLEAGALNKFNVNANPQLAAFNQAAQNIMGLKASELATRPGFGTLSLVGSVKPSAWKPVSANLGAVEEIEKNFKNIFNLYNQFYSSATGKELPWTPFSGEKNTSLEEGQNQIQNDLSGASQIPINAANGEIKVRNRKTGQIESLTLDQAKAFGII